MLEKGAYSREQTRRNVKAFFVGKVASALVTMALLGAVVRWLDERQYAAYLAAIAAIELTVAMFAFGLDWVALRYVPELRLAGRTQVLRSLVGRLTLMRGVSALIGGAGLALATALGDWSWLRQASGAGLALWMGALVVQESLLRMLRDTMLEALALQRSLQIGMLVRSGSVLILLAVAAATGLAQTASNLLVFELLASLTATAYVLAVLIRSLRRAGAEAGSAAHDLSVPLPSLSKMLRVGLQNYSSSLLAFPLGMSTLTMLVSAHSSAAVTSAFGFVARLVDIIRGYAPALMLMGVLRPRLVALYHSTKDFQRLRAEAWTASRLSMISMAPLAAAIVFGGGQVLDGLSNHKAAGAEVLLGALVALLLLRIHRLMTVVVANCIDRSHVLVRASAAGVLGFSFAWWGARTGHPFVGVVSAIALDECLWLWWCTRALRAADAPWPWAFGVAARALACCMACGALLRAGVDLAGSPEWVAGLLTVPLSLIAMERLRLWRLGELLHLLGRPRARD